MSLPQDRRRYLRADVKWPVTLQHSQGLMESVTTNVSVDGVFIRCLEPPKANEAVEIIVNIPDINRPFKIIGEVAWSNIDGSDDEITPHGVGIRFKDVY